MRWTGRILLLIVTALWYGIIVPGHTRGVISVPQPGDAAGARESCCAGKRASHCDDQGERRGPGPGSVSTCAICQLVSVTPVPTAIHFEVLEPRLLAELPPAKHESVRLPGHAISHRGRDPPMHAVI